MVLYTPIFPFLYLMQYVFDQAIRWHQYLCTAACFIPSLVAWICTLLEEQTCLVCLCDVSPSLIFDNQDKICLKKQLFRLGQVDISSVHNTEGTYTQNYNVYSPISSWLCMYVHHKTISCTFLSLILNFHISCAGKIFLRKSSALTKAIIAI